MRCSSVVASAEYSDLILRSRIVIAHRFSTVRTANVILVVEGGRIIERGTHERLLARRGRSAELYVTRLGDATAAARRLPVWTGHYAKRCAANRSRGGLCRDTSRRVQFTED